jgi:hypothetical protein
MLSTTLTYLTDLNIINISDFEFGFRLKILRGAGRSAKPPPVTTVVISGPHEEGRSPAGADEPGTGP